MTTNPFELTHTETCELIQSHRVQIFKTVQTFDYLRYKIEAAKTDAEFYGFDANLICCSDEKFLEFIQSKP